MQFRPCLTIVLLGLFLPLEVAAYRVPERDAWRAYALSLINASRGEAGLPPLGLDEELSDLAQAHAVDSAGHFDDSTEETRRGTYIRHTSSDGKELPDRIREHGINGLSAAGENVGFRYLHPLEGLSTFLAETLTRLHEAMMAEKPPNDGHRRTILGDYTHVGVGLELHREADSEMNTLFLVTDFGTFVDGRPVIIPTVQLRSRSPTLSTPTSRTSTTPTASRLQRLQRRTRKVLLRERRWKTDLTIPRSPERSLLQKGREVPASPLEQRRRRRVQERRERRLKRLPSSHSASPRPSPTRI